MASRETAVYSTKKKSFWQKGILFGDSLTQFSFSVDGCWGSLISDHLQRKCDIINRGFSGYNTKWCKIILPQVISEFDPNDVAFITIFLGANDSNLPPNTLQHVPLRNYKQDLIDMVEILQNYGIPRDRIILISPPMCDEKAWKEDCDRNNRLFTKCNETAGEYSQACLEAAKECGTGSVDLYGNMSRAENWKKMLNDGLHLSVEGSTLLFNLLKPLLNKAAEGIHVAYPEWNNVDNNNLRESLQPNSK